MFHADGLFSLIPSRLYSSLVQERFYRLQGESEPLFDFVNSIKQIAKVLRLNKTEQEIVSTIVEGLNPSERSRIVFCSRPNNFAELDQLTVHSQNVYYCDQQRKVLEPGRNVPTTPFSNRPRHSSSRSNYFSPNANFNKINTSKFNQPNKSSSTNSKNFQPKPGSSGSFNRNDVICYSCNNKGHYSSECKNRDKPKNS